MDLEKHWEKALQSTEIVRPRIQPLSAWETTLVPYIFLSEALSASHSTLVRKGKVAVERPSLVLPSNHPQLEGFELDEVLRKEADGFMDFLLVRGVRFPSMKFNNLTDSIAVHDGSLQSAIDQHLSQLQKQEDLTAGLVIGREDCWQFSILVFVGSQVLRSAESDIRRLIDEFKKRKG